MRILDRRSRSHFWVDDSVIDRYGPWLGRQAAGTAAIVVYFVLARHAGKDADTWPSVQLISDTTGVSRRSVQRALRVLEVAGLIAITECIDAGTDRQTSSIYTLLTPTEPPAYETEQDWPPVSRQRLRVVFVDGKRVLAENANTCSGGCHRDTGEGVTGTRGGRHTDTPRARVLDLTKEHSSKEPPADGLEKAVERWQRSQERLTSGPFSKPPKGR